MRSWPTEVNYLTMSVVQCAGHVCIYYRIRFLGLRHLENVLYSVEGSIPVTHPSIFVVFVYGKYTLWVSQITMECLIQQTNISFPVAGEGQEIATGQVSALFPLERWMLCSTCMFVVQRTHQLTHVCCVHFVNDTHISLHKTYWNCFPTKANIFTQKQFHYQSSWPYRWSGRQYLHREPCVTYRMHFGTTHNILFPFINVLLKLLDRGMLGMVV